MHAEAFESVSLSYDAKNQKIMRMYRCFSVHPPGKFEGAPAHRVKSFRAYLRLDNGALILQCG